MPPTRGYTAGCRCSGSWTSCCATGSGCWAGRRTWPASWPRPPRCTSGRSPWCSRCWSPSCCSRCRCRWPAPGAKASRTHVLLATAAATVLVLLLVAAARRYHSEPQFRAVMVSVAAGVCFAMTAVFITLTADDLIHRGIPATAVDWPGYALAGSTLLGLLLEQDAFATGSLATAVAAMTITNPIASYLLGVLAFEADAPDEPGALAGLASAGLLVVVGVIILS